MSFNLVIHKTSKACVAAIIELKLKMIANKLYKTHKDSIKVIHNKTDISKDKIIDYLESVINTLTKPVDKIHISNFMSMGKKNKKTKKNKKDKIKKKLKKHIKDKKDTQKNKRLKKQKRIKQ